MTGKITYTAQEMREEADKLDEFCRVFEKKSRTPAMLRQAADDAAELAKAKRPDACPANPTNKMCYLPGEYCCDTVRYLQKENAKLKARLETVVKVAKEQFDYIFHSPMCWDEDENETHSLEQLREMDALEKIVAIVRGDAGKEAR